MTNFILKTRYGAPIYTTDDRRKALAEAMRVRAEFPGLYLVEEIIPPPVERRIWTDRQGSNVVDLRRAAS